MMKEKVRRVLAGLLVPALVWVLMGCALAVYHAAPEALALLEEEGVWTEDNLTVLSAEGADTALIFYPGALVEPASYLPLLEGVRQMGVSCIIVEMPLGMAFLDLNAADEVMERFPEVEHWLLGGHSLGGAMVSQYAARHADRAEALILLGAYIYGDYPAEQALTVYGSLDRGLGTGLGYTENVVILEGGNHAQFGNYGPQLGDPEAEISAGEQQAQTLEAIQSFLAGRGLL